MRAGRHRQHSGLSALKRLGFALVLTPMVLMTPAQANTGMVAAVLPASRSVETGQPATLFATILATSPITFPDCEVALDTSLPLTLTYQETDPLTNLAIGSPNTPVDLPGGGSVSFVISLVSQESFTPQEVALNFSCGPISATSISGINTVLLSVSDDPTPDLVALARTTTNDGVVLLDHTTNAGAFAVATINLGAAGDLSMQAAKSMPDLPVLLSWCQTNSQSGACLGDGPTTEPLDFEALNQGTPTFAVFATTTEDIEFSPAQNRIFVEFSDAAGALRGSTSVAVRLSRADQSIAFDVSNTAAAIERVGGAFSRAIRWKDIALRALQLANASTTLEFSDPCPEGPTNYTITDRDRNGLLSSGDSLTTTYSGCFESSFEGAPRGTLTIELTSLTADSSGQFTLLAAEVEFSGMSVLPSVQSEPRRDVSGGFDIEYARTTTRISSTLRADSELGFIESANGLTDRFTNVEIKQNGELSDRQARTLEMQGQLESGILNGKALCESTSFTLDEDSRFAPTSGELKCIGEDGSEAILAAPDLLLNRLANESTLSPAGRFSWGASEMQALVAPIPDVVFVVPDTSRRELEPAMTLDVDVDLATSSPATGLVYLSSGNSIAAIDPASGDTDHSISLPGQPSTISVGNNGTLLFVGYSDENFIQTYALPSGALVRTVNLGTSSEGAEWFASRVAASPTEDWAVVVLQEIDPVFNRNSIILIRGDEIAPDSIDNRSSPISLLVRDDGRAFSALNQSMTEFLITPSGLALGDSLNWERNLSSEGELLAGNSRFYTASGGVFDFEQGTQAGRLLRLDNSRRDPLLAVSEPDNLAVTLSLDEVVIFDTDRFQNGGRYHLPGSSNSNFLYIIKNQLIAIGESKLFSVDLDQLEAFDSTSCSRIDLALLGLITDSQRYNCPIRNIRYSSVTDRLYGLADGELGLDGNSLWVINPSTLEVERNIYLGVSPSQLEIADDGEHALIGFADTSELVLVDLVSQEIERRLPLVSSNSMGTNRQPLFATAIDFAPGSSEDATIAVGDFSLRVMRGDQIISGVENQFGRVQDLIYSSADSTLVYGLDEGDLYSFRITDSVIAFEAFLGTVEDGAGLVVANQFLYTPTGQKLNVADLSTVATYDLESITGEEFPFSSPIALDDAGDRIFYQLSEPQLRLGIFEESTGASLPSSSTDLLNELLRGGASELHAQHPDWLIFTDERTLFLPKSEILD